MITYELAKKLKEAEFPFNWELYNDNGVLESFEPTLSELIEACGAATFWKLESDGRAWFARAESIEYPTAMFEGQGSTPEEAVANLYLAINKK